MGYCGLCFLCGKTIDSTCSGRDEWRTVFQLPQLENSAKGAGPLVGPSTTFIPRGVKYMMHSLCWSVVAKALGAESVRVEWLDNFGRLLQDMAPFLTRMRFPHSPEIPNEVENIGPELVEKSPFRSTSSRFPLPYEIIQMIYRHLCYQDVCHLREVAGVKPDTRVWFDLGRRYLVYGSLFFKGSREEVSSKIERILWNLHYRATSIPHICNYSSVWDNVEILFSKIGQPCFGIDENPSIRYIFLYPIRWKGLIDHIIDFYPMPKMSFNFSHIPGRSYLCGFQTELNSFGYKGESAVTISLKELCGLRLVSDAEGFIALQVKNTSWEESWYGSSLDSGDLVFTQIEWPIGYPVKFAVSFDAFKIHAISLSHTTGLPQHRSISWKSRLPPQDLIPVFLADRGPTDGILPLSYVDRQLETADTISAFIEPSTQSITGFEFNFGGIRLCAGNIDRRSTKLSFCTNTQAREIFIGVACAKSVDTTHITVKFFTSFGRCIIFGNPKVDEWHTSVSPNGVFCTYLGNREINGISIVGALQREPEYQQKTTNFFLPTAQYPTTTIGFRNFQPYIVFISSANLTAVSSITVYREPLSNYLCGVKILHKSGFSDILGEVREEIQSFIPGEDLIYIRVFYAVIYGICYRVRGLRFGYASHSIDVGCLEGWLVENIDLSSHILYWLFQSGFSYLALTTSNIILPARC